jgi:hypothetical protein
MDAATYTNRRLYDCDELHLGARRRSPMEREIRGNVVHEGELLADGLDVPRRLLGNRLRNRGALPAVLLGRKRRAHSPGGGPVSPFARRGGKTRHAASDRLARDAGPVRTRPPYPAAVDGPSRS